VSYPTGGQEMGITFEVEVERDFSLSPSKNSSSTILRIILSTNPPSKFFVISQVEKDFRVKAHSMT
jgi:hypothetical protein